jgi:anti-sigma B factor antagonist
MSDSRLDIPGPRLVDADAPLLLQAQARDLSPYVTVVEVHGDLDELTAPRFRGWLTERLVGLADVVLDLDDVAFMASSGIAVLMGLRKDAQRLGVRLHLTGRRNRTVWRPLQVLGLESTFNLQDDARSVVADLILSG